MIIFNFIQIKLPEQNVSPEMHVLHDESNFEQDLNKMHFENCL
jgi:hypothetical protein